MEEYFILFYISDVREKRLTAFEYFILKVAPKAPSGFDKTFLFHL